jgi:hypothetical protein
MKPEMKPTEKPTTSESGCAVILKDGESTEIMRFEDLRAYRYGEIFLICGEAGTSMYNTTGLNDKEDPRDSCPAELWANVDPGTLKKQYDVLGVFKNGPRVWTVDWIELPVGTKRDFNGLEARWLAYPQLPKGVDLHKAGSTAYIPVKVERKSKMGFVKGQPVFILDDPDGMPWVMQACSQIVDPNLTYADLQTLGKKLKLLPGWTYRVKVLDQDLMIQAVNGIAIVLQDDLQNTYNACFETACSYRP